MNAINALLVVIGVIIFISSFVSGGLLINLGAYGYFAWFIGLILVAIGLAIFSFQINICYLSVYKGVVVFKL